MASPKWPKDFDSKLPTFFGLEIPVETPQVDEAPGFEDGSESSEEVELPAVTRFSVVFSVFSVYM